jgi:hypothetical protein
VRSRRDTFAGDLPLELGKGQQHIEHQLSHRARRVGLLRHRHERHSLGVEEFDQPGKIDERAGQPIDLVDDHDVDPADPDIGDQVLQGGSLQTATGEAAIVIAGSDRYPALVALAADVRLAGFALRRERVEFLLEPFLGGFASVDRAALAARVSPRHRCSLSARRLDPALARTRGRLNQVERFFANLTEKQIRRGVHRSTAELEAAIKAYIAAVNANPRPFVWTKSADDILATIKRFCLANLKIAQPQNLISLPAHHQVSGH